MCVYGFTSVCEGASVGKCINQHNIFAKRSVRKMKVWI